MEKYLDMFKAWFSANWPDFRGWLYRWVRGAFATAAAQTLLVACNQVFETLDVIKCFFTIRDQWTDPKQVAAVLTVAFVSGFLMALGKAIRDKFGGLGRSGEVSTLDRVLPV